MNRVAAVIFGVAGLWFLFLGSPRSSMEPLVKYAFAAILLYAAYQRFRSPAKKTAEYVREQANEGLRLLVSPAAAPVLWLPALLSVGMGAGVVGSGLAFSWVFGALFAAGTWLLLVKEHRGGGRIGPRSILVNAQGIQTEGIALRKEDIHYLRIRNKFGAGVEIVYDADRGLPTGTAIGLGGRKALADVAYRVEVEAGGKAHVLAGGLDEVTARGIATEIGRALNRTPVAA
jgi:hypothetical protein